MNRHTDKKSADLFCKVHKEQTLKKDLKIPIIINAFGGPGSGKSTACMEICAGLKKMGYSAEYVQEYAKDLIYDNQMDLLDGSERNQFLILAEQLKRMDFYYGKVDFIVTDSPILLNGIYNQELTPAYNEMIQNLHSQYKNFCFFVKRDPESFEQSGRIHNLDESIHKDHEIMDMLKQNNIFFGSYFHKNISKVTENAIQTKNRLEHRHTHDSPPRHKIYSQEEKEDMTGFLKRSLSIVDVAASLGYHPVKKGSRYYSLQEHDSVMLDLQKNCFWRNSDASSNARGSVIDFCNYFGDMDTSETFKYLYELAGGEENVYQSVIGTSQAKQPTPGAYPPPAAGKEMPPASVQLPEKDVTQKNVFAYLLKTRSLHKDVVQEFYDNGMLYQDSKKNCVFVSKDNDGKPVFACKRGTNTNYRFVADCSGNDYTKGFYINNGVSADKLFISESVIDAMSYMSFLHSRGLDYHEYNYLCLTGTGKQMMVENVLNQSPQVKTVLFGLDNDKSGLKATEELKQLIQEHDKSIHCIDQSPPVGKDWNEYLQQRTSPVHNHPKPEKKNPILKALSEQSSLVLHNKAQEIEIS